MTSFLTQQGIPLTNWVHYGTNSVQRSAPHAAIQRIRIYIRNHIVVKGYPRYPLVVWNGAWGKRVEENSKVRDVLS
jgi:hypothetical protein